MTPGRFDVTTSSRREDYQEKLCFAAEAVHRVQISGTGEQRGLVRAGFDSEGWCSNYEKGIAEIV